MMEGRPPRVTLFSWLEGGPKARYTAPVEGVMWWMALAWSAPTLVPQQIEIGGTRRAALVYLPDKVSDAPVVIAYHGIGGHPMGVADQWLPLAVEHRFILVVPVTPKPKDWFVSEGVFDARLYTAWRAWGLRQGGDPSAVYVMGFSMGAHFAASLVCTGEQVTAVGLVSMSLVERVEQNCDGVATPLVYIASARDRLATKGGHKRIGPLQVRFTSQERTLRRFAAFDQCTPPKDNKVRAGQPWIRDWDCSAAPLRSVQLPGADHALPTEPIHAARFIWEFFATHRSFKNK